MLAPKFCQRKIALLMAALLLVVPASAQDPVDPDEDSAVEETDDPTDPTDTESDTEASDATDFGEPLMMDRDDMLFQASDIEEILITGEKQNTLQDAQTSSTSFSAGDLQALRIEDIADLADYTPNLEINTAFAASNPTIFIRGTAWGGRAGFGSGGFGSGGFGSGGFGATTARGRGASRGGATAGGRRVGCGAGPRGSRSTGSMSSSTTTSPGGVKSRSRKSR